MRILATVPFEQVLKAFLQDHPHVMEGMDDEDNTNDDAEENLCQAQLVLGRWQRVVLDRSEVLDVVLPWHMGEYGEHELIPPAGMTVGSATTRLRELDEAYLNGNPRCAAKLEHHARAPMSPLYLSTRPVPGPDYERLEAVEGLIHLDGLHRMLAWERAGRLDGDVAVEAYLAVEGAVPPARSAAGPAEDVRRVRRAVRSS
ncbi:DUF6309 family protein [Streptomyces sp. NPDC047315]|uniref:DUF6309 family protein n=1 Tax=Streptomyces sp. NPDC047315 TaxID=3155142 RepID=UPI0033E536D3